MPRGRRLPAWGADALLGGAVGLAVWIEVAGWWLPHDAEVRPVDAAGWVLAGLVAGGPFDRVYTDDIDERLGFFDGAFRWSFPINGKLYPYGDMHMVRPGDRVKVVIRNRSSATHPMHLHGHHFTVLSRDGRPLTGSPVVLDTLDIAPGETWEIAFVADNPGVWMDHCHNQEHAANGMDPMVAYEGVTTPFEAGRATGNRPE